MNTNSGLTVLVLLLAIAIFRIGGQSNLLPGFRSRKCIVPFQPLWVWVMNKTQTEEQNDAA